jgi:preprotein translocase subunit SecA
MSIRDKIKFRSLLNIIRPVPVECDLKNYQSLRIEIDKQDLSARTDASLKDLSSALAARARQGIPLDRLLVEAFALVREASRRVLGLRPFDVQVMAGIVMHQGKLAELPTGEGKTLAAVFPAYLNALTGRGVHVHTFNDYLARRDADWMGPVFEFLGLRAGYIQESMNISERQAAYACDITYATAKEAGFDFLRDNLCYEKADLVHRPFHFAIVDEADSILIDEARVPLVIAGAAGGLEAGPCFADIAAAARPGLDFRTDDSGRNIYLTDEGIQRMESLLGRDNLHDPENADLLTGINQALHAAYLLNRDIDYIVRDGKVEIVDEFTGRVVEDRHWPDGLQAAVEAKESLRPGPGGSILGSITLQHFLKMYPRLCGMTATARSAGEAFYDFYGLKSVIIPPHKPCIRKDLPDAVFTHREAKRKALVREIGRWHEKGRPVLVGTASVEESEELAGALKASRIGCRVLNAKNDALEAGIIARAGAPGAVTISTNMAGRGTDIKLGGENEQEREKVVSLGGLYVIGTNRHESLRIDRQLRGRAGRQGDPGASRFFVSLEDPLIRQNGILERLPSRIRRLRQDAPLDHPLVRREIVHGQRMVEGRNFDIRRTLWNYAFLVENQRRRIFKWRREVLFREAPPGLLRERAAARYSQWSKVLGEEAMASIELRITLFEIDRAWTAHLAMIADVRESIHLVNVAGKSPLDEFHRILTPEFLALEAKIKEAVVETFKSLALKDGRIDLALAGIRGPSSTWTYLVNDNPFGDWMSLIKGSNIGFAAFGAFLFFPFYIGYGIYQKLFRRREKADSG